MPALEELEGGVTAPAGFRAAGVHAGLKPDQPDLALLVSDVQASAAGTFTRNRVQGPTVRLCRERLAAGRARAVVINSGNANACVGPAGRRDAECMAATAATALGLDPAEVLVCSTGVIGVPLPMDRVTSGIRTATDALCADGGGAAARAIMTTDTVPKQAAVGLEVGDRPVRIGGMAKGAGMIEPDMATMLAFITTDAAVRPGDLQAGLAAAVARSFNRITVDGDQSCNDTVLALANGRAGNEPLHRAVPGWQVFQAGLDAVALRLARAIVEDGEGATRFVTVTVRGAVSDGEAERVARTIANSLLVKTSWFGGDPNWGRVMDAAGHAGAELRERQVDIFYDDICAVRGGMQAPGLALSELEEVLARPRFTVTLDLHLGDGTATLYTCDISTEYVRINSEYTS